MKKEKEYIEGNYYDNYGVYLGIRTTYSPNKEQITEHIFRTDKYDSNGAAHLKRISIF
tara:strand:- start:172 stop:345 length:174 start_codon:yes stop_codon:yes gene_type:complete